MYSVVDQRDTAAGIFFSQQVHIICIPKLLITNPCTLIPLATAVHSSPLVLQYSVLLPSLSSNEMNKTLREIGSDSRLPNLLRIKLVHFAFVYLSRVCAVAQYAVLEANGKVNGILEISNPSPSPTIRPIWMSLQIYHYVRPGSRCAKFD